MKTCKILLARKFASCLFSTAVLMIALSIPCSAQEKVSIFGTGSDIGFVWGIEMKTSSIQRVPGTQYGMFAGALFQHAIMVGLTAAANVTHPSVNYGYTALMIQYSHQQHRLVHLNCQLTLGNGSTKDYENEKSSVFDNFGNVTGANFYMVEPGINVEVNLGRKTKLWLGTGYRFVYGIDPGNTHVSITHVSDRDLSGFNANLGIKFGLY